MATLSAQQIQFEQALANLLDAYGVSLDGASGDNTYSVIATDARLAIIQLAKVKLDEVIPAGEALQFSVEGDINVSDPLNIMIHALLDEAAKRVLMSCPLHYLNPVKSNVTAGIPNTDDKIGHIVLPDNFLRFVSLKMADWTKAVTDIIRPEIEPVRYSIQQNKYTRGKTAKPQAAYSHRYTADTHSKVIEYYSVNASHNIEYLFYIQETVAEEVQSNLMDALTWEVAGMVLQVTERVDLAKVAFEKRESCYNNL